jgi:hypothetical protein
MRRPAPRGSFIRVVGELRTDRVLLLLAEFRELVPNPFVDADTDRIGPQLLGDA